MEPMAFPTLTKQEISTKTERPLMIHAEMRGAGETIPRKAGQRFLKAFAARGAMEKRALVERELATALPRMGVACLLIALRTPKAEFVRTTLKLLSAPMIGMGLAFQPAKVKVVKEETSQ